MTQADIYEVPYHWWGPGPSPQARLTLPDLIRNGTLDEERAATLWATVGARRSLTIIGGPSGLGKSTLLQALLPALPRDTQRVYLRGCYETFAFLREPLLAPATCALLVNEISPHLPIYLWGPAVQRTLQAAGQGYQVLATAHGRSVVEFLASLTGSPLRVPAPMLDAINLVVLLEPLPSGRRVTELWQLSSARGGVGVDRLARSDLPAGVTADMISVARAQVTSMLTDDEGRVERVNLARD